MELTPTKQKPDGGPVPPSPGAKRVLEFDFMAEVRRKVPKIIQEDLEYCRLEDLKEVRAFDKAIKVKCIAVMSAPRVFKAALRDDSGFITAVAFGDSTKGLAKQFEVGKWYTLSNFQVKPENADYLTGAVHDLQVILEDGAAYVQPMQMEDDLKPNLQTVEDLKLLPDNTLADLICVCVQEWGQSSTARGNLKTDISVMDKSEQTMKLTFWGEKGNQLVGSKFQILKLENIGVGSQMLNAETRIKCLKSLWFSNLTVLKETPESREMQAWFQNLMKHTSA